MASSETLFWEFAGPALERQGWAAALLGGDTLVHCNELFQRCLQRYWAAGSGPGPGPIRLQLQELPGAIADCPDELRPWRGQLQRVALHWRGVPRSSRPLAVNFLALFFETAGQRWTLVFGAMAPARPSALLIHALEQCGVAALLTDASAAIVYVNRRFTEITGYVLGQLKGCNPSVLQSGRTPRRVYQDMWSRLHAGEIWEGRVLNRRADGSHYWSFQTVSPLFADGERGEVIGYLSLSHDSTTLYDDYLSLQELAYYDGLCGVPNRRALHNHLDALLEARNGRGEGKLALLLINIDHFKLINDGYGHEAGDAVLRTVCERIGRRNSLHGLVARLGGDEFAVVVPEPGEDGDLLELADQLLLEVTRPIAFNDHSISVSASAGMALAPRHAGDTETLLRHADCANREAKRSGRNCCVLYHPGMEKAGDARIADRGALTRALEKDELFPVFQPVVSCHEPVVAYYESLVRWQHPELGLLAPAQFLPAFKRFGLMTRLNSWMLDHACAELAGLGEQARLSLNIGAPDLMQEDCAERIHHCLARHGIAPSRVRLEITEGELIENFAVCERSINQLRATGMQLYIDDFGVGYASLAWLRRLPVDGIKLDRSFLQGFPHDRQAVDIIAAVVDLAHRLDLEVTAEGVETLDQARLLTRLGCDYLQGFLFGRPMRSRLLPSRHR